MQKWICDVCEWVYDPQEGDRNHQFNAGETQNSGAPRSAARRHSFVSWLVHSQSSLIALAL